MLNRDDDATRTHTEGEYPQEIRHTKLTGLPDFGKNIGDQKNWSKNKKKGRIQEKKFYYFFFIKKLNKMQKIVRVAIFGGIFRKVDFNVFGTFETYEDMLKPPHFMGYDF